MQSRIVDANKYNEELHAAIEIEEFLYTLRRGGLKVSLTEWMALMEALEKELHGSSFTGFYHLCRALLVKSEADFDRFDRCFRQYFKDVPFEQEAC